MIDDFSHWERVAANDPNLQVDQERLYVEALEHIERYLRAHSKSLCDYVGMPFPVDKFLGFQEEGNPFITQERSYDYAALEQYVLSLALLGIVFDCSNS
jgi:hypothetical protein